MGHRQPGLGISLSAFWSSVRRSLGDRSRPRAVAQRGRHQCHSFGTEIQQLEERMVLARIVYLSGVPTGDSSYHFSAPNEDPPNVFESSVMTQIDDDNYVTSPERDSNEYPVAFADAFVSTGGTSLGAPQGHTPIYNRYRMNVEGFTNTGGVTSSADAFLDISGNGTPVTYVIQGDNPNEQIGDRVRVRFQMEAVLGAGNFGGTAEGTVLTYHVGYQIGNSDAAVDIGTANVRTGAGSYEEIDKDFVIEAKIGDVIIPILTLEGSIASGTRGNPQIQASVDFGWQIDSTVDLWVWNTRLNETGTQLLFDYNVDNEAISIFDDPVIRFYFANGNHVHQVYNSFNGNFLPADAAQSPAQAEFHIDTTDLKTIGTHTASVNLSVFGAPTVAQDSLLVYIDPDDVVDEYVEGNNFWLVTNPIAPVAVLNINGPEVVYFNRQSPITVAPLLLVNNPISPDTLSGATLELQIVTANTAKKQYDTFGMNSPASIGTVEENGRSGDVLALTIVLKSGITAAEVQAFLRSVTFSTTKKGLGLESRHVTAKITDFNGQIGLTTQIIHVLKKLPKPGHSTHAEPHAGT